MPSSKKNSDIQYKAAPQGMVNLDEAEGIVECFVAGIGNKDSVGDVCAPGAFGKSLIRRKPRVVWGHNWNDPIGKVLDMYEVSPSDPRLPNKMKAAGIGGLYARVQFNLKSEKGREAFANVAFFGEEQEWSIGYKTINAKFDPQMQANILYEVELYEVSPVLHGANQLTGTISIKSENQSSTVLVNEQPSIDGLNVNELSSVLDALKTIAYSADEKCGPGMPMGMPAQMPMGMPTSGPGMPSAPKPMQVQAPREAVKPEVPSMPENPMLVAIRRELVDRTGSNIIVRSVIENIVVFDRITSDGISSTYKLPFNYANNEFMFGKPEKINTQPTPESSIPTMPGMPQQFGGFDTGKSLISFDDFSWVGFNQQIPAQQVDVSTLNNVISNLEKIIEEKSTYIIPVDMNNAFEVKQAIDPILDYYRVDATVTEDGIIVKSLDNEFLNAMDIATKGVLRSIGNMVGRAVDRPNIGKNRRDRNPNLASRGRGIGSRGAVVRLADGTMWDPKTAPDRNNNGIVGEGLTDGRGMSLSQPDPTPDGPASIRAPKTPKTPKATAPKASRAPKKATRLSSGATDYDASFKRNGWKKKGDKWSKGNWEIEATGPNGLSAYNPKNPETLEQERDPSVSALRHLNQFERILRGSDDTNFDDDTRLSSGNISPDENLIAMSLQEDLNPRVDDGQIDSGIAEAGKRIASRWGKLSKAKKNEAVVDKFGLSIDDASNQEIIDTAIDLAGNEGLLDDLNLSRLSSGRDDSSYARELAKQREMDKARGASATNPVGKEAVEQAKKLDKERAAARLRQEAIDSFEGMTPAEYQGWVEDYTDGGNSIGPGDTSSEVREMFIDDYIYANENTKLNKREMDFRKTPKSETRLSSGATNVVKIDIPEIDEAIEELAAKDIGMNIQRFRELRDEGRLPGRYQEAFQARVQVLNDIFSGLSKEKLDESPGKVLSEVKKQLVDALSSEKNDSGFIQGFYDRKELQNFIDGIENIVELALVDYSRAGDEESELADDLMDDFRESLQKISEKSKKLFDARTRSFRGTEPAKSKKEAQSEKERLFELLKNPLDMEELADYLDSTNGVVPTNAFLDRIRQGNVSDEDLVEINGFLEDALENIITLDPSLDPEKLAKEFSDAIREGAKNDESGVIQRIAKELGDDGVSEDLVQYLKDGKSNSPFVSNRGKKEREVLRLSSGAGRTEAERLANWKQINTDKKAIRKAIEGLDTSKGDNPERYRAFQEVFNDIERLVLNAEEEFDMLLQGPTEKSTRRFEGLIQDGNFVQARNHLIGVLSGVGGRSREKEEFGFGDLRLSSGEWTKTDDGFEMDAPDIDGGYQIQGNSKDGFVVTRFADARRNGGQDAQEYEHDKVFTSSSAAKKWAERNYKLIGEEIGKEDTEIRKTDAARSADLADMTPEEAADYAAYMDEERWRDRDDRFSSGQKPLTDQQVANTKKRLAALEAALESGDEEAQKELLKKIFKGKSYLETYIGEQFGKPVLYQRPKILGRDGYSSDAPEKEITDEDLINFIRDKYLNDNMNNLLETRDEEVWGNPPLYDPDEEQEYVENMDDYARAIEILEEENIDETSYDIPSTIEEIADILGSEELLFDEVQKQILARQQKLKNNETRLSSGMDFDKKGASGLREMRHVERNPLRMDSSAEKAERDAYEKDVAAFIKNNGWFVEVPMYNGDPKWQSEDWYRAREFATNVAKLRFEDDYLNEQMRLFDKPGKPSKKDFFAKKGTVDYKSWYMAKTALLTSEIDSVLNSDLYSDNYKESYMNAIRSFLYVNRPEFGPYSNGDDPAYQAWLQQAGLGWGGRYSTSGPKFDEMGRFSSGATRGSRKDNYVLSYDNPEDLREAMFAELIANNMGDYQDMTAEDLAYALNVRAVHVEPLLEQVKRDVSKAVDDFEKRSTGKDLTDAEEQELTNDFARAQDRREADIQALANDFARAQTVANKFADMTPEEAADYAAYMDEESWRDRDGRFSSGATGSTSEDRITKFYKDMAERNAVLSEMTPDELADYAEQWNENHAEDSRLSSGGVNYYDWMKKQGVPRSTVDGERFSGRDSYGHTFHDYFAEDAFANIDEAIVEALLFDRTQRTPVQDLAKEARKYSIDLAVDGFAKPENLRAESLVRRPDEIGANARRVAEAVANNSRGKGREPSREDILHFTYDGKQRSVYPESFGTSKKGVAFFRAWDETADDGNGAYRSFNVDKIEGLVSHAIPPYVEIGNRTPDAKWSISDFSIEDWAKINDRFFPSRELRDAQFDVRNAIQEELEATETRAPGSIIDTAERELKREMQIAFDRHIDEMVEKGSSRFSSQFGVKPLNKESRLSSGGSGRFDISSARSFDDMSDKEQLAVFNGIKDRLSENNPSMVSVLEDGGLDIDGYLADFPQLHPDFSSAVTAHKMDEEYIALDDDKKKLADIIEEAIAGGVIKDENSWQDWVSNFASDFGTDEDLYESVYGEVTEDQIYDVLNNTAWERRPTRDEVRDEVYGSAEYEPADLLAFAVEGLTEENFAEFLKNWEGGKWGYNSRKVNDFSDKEKEDTLKKISDDKLAIAKSSRRPLKEDGTVDLDDYYSKNDEYLTDGKFDLEKFLKNNMTYHPDYSNGWDPVKGGYRTAPDNSRLSSGESKLFDIENARSFDNMSEGEQRQVFEDIKDRLSETNPSVVGDLEDGGLDIDGYLQEFPQLHPDFPSPEGERFSSGRGPRPRGKTLKYGFVEDKSPRYINRDGKKFVEVTDGQSLFVDLYDRRDIYPGDSRPSRLTIDEIRDENGKPTGKFALGMLVWDDYEGYYDDEPDWDAGSEPSDEEFDSIDSAMEFARNWARERGQIFGASREEMDDEFWYDSSVTRETADAAFEADFERYNAKRDAEMEAWRAANPEGDRLSSGKSKARGNRGDGKGRGTAWSAEDRRRFADGDVLRAQTRPGKRRQGPSVGEFSSGARFAPDGESGSRIQRRLSSGEYFGPPPTGSDRYDRKKQVGATLATFHTDPGTAVISPDMSGVLGTVPKGRESHVLNSAVAEKIIANPDMEYSADNGWPVDAGKLLDFIEVNEEDAIRTLREIGDAQRIATILGIPESSAQDMLNGKPVYIGSGTAADMFDSLRASGDYPDSVGGFNDVARVWGFDGAPKWVRVSDIATPEYDLNENGDVNWSAEKWDGLSRAQFDAEVRNGKNPPEPVYISPVEFFNGDAIASNPKWDARAGSFKNPTVDAEFAVAPRAARRSEQLEPTRMPSQARVGERTAMADKDFAAKWIKRGHGVTAANMMDILGVERDSEKSDPSTEEMNRLIEAMNEIGAKAGLSPLSPTRPATKSELKKSGISDEFMHALVTSGRFKNMKEAMAGLGDSKFDSLAAEYDSRMLTDAALIRIKDKMNKDGVPDANKIIAKAMTTALGRKTDVEARVKEGRVTIKGDMKEDGMISDAKISEILSFVNEALASSGYPEINQDELFPKDETGGYVDNLSSAIPGGSRMSSGQRFIARTSSSRRVDATNDAATRREGNASRLSSGASVPFKDENGKLVPNNIGQAAREATPTGPGFDNNPTIQRKTPHQNLEEFEKALKTRQAISELFAMNRKNTPGFSVYDYEDELIKAGFPSEEIEKMVDSFVQLDSYIDDVETYFEEAREKLDKTLEDIEDSLSKIERLKKAKTDAIKKWGDTEDNAFVLAIEDKIAAEMMKIDEAYQSGIGGKDGRLGTLHPRLEKMMTEMPGWSEGPYGMGNDINQRLLEVEASITKAGGTRKAVAITGIDFGVPEGTRLSSGRADEYYQNLTSHLIAMIEKSQKEGGKWDAPWHRAGNIPRNASTKNMYSGGNLFALMLAAEEKGYTTPHWAGFQQWKKLGGTVKKGEKATIILIPRQIFGEEIDDNGVKIRKSKGVSFSTAHVFNLDQIEGIDREKFLETPTDALTPEQRVGKLEDAIKEIGATIDTGDGSSAYYSPSEDRVVMPPFELFKSPEGYYGTLAHELVHWTGHSSRLDRKSMNQFGSPEYAREELIAEFGAAFLLAQFGLSSIPREDHAHYLANWLQVLRDEPNALQEASIKAQAASKLLIEKMKIVLEEMGVAVSDAESAAEVKSLQVFNDPLYGVKDAYIEWSKDPFNAPFLVKSLSDENHSSGLVNRSWERIAETAIFLERLSRKK